MGPERQQEQLLYELLAGGLEEFRKAGATIVGGHTIEGENVTIGFTVLADAGDRPRELKGNLRAGDKLVFTKPLGSGILLAAHNQARLRARGSIRRCPCCWPATSGLPRSLASSRCKRHRRDRFRPGRSSARNAPRQRRSGGCGWHRFAALARSRRACGGRNREHARPGQSPHRDRNRKPFGRRDATRPAPLGGLRRALRPANFRRVAVRRALRPGRSRCSPSCARRETLRRRTSAKSCGSKPTGRGCGWFEAIIEFAFAQFLRVAAAIIGRRTLQGATALKSADGGSLAQSPPFASPPALGRQLFCRRYAQVIIVDVDRSHFVVTDDLTPITRVVQLTA